LFLLIKLACLLLLNTMRTLCQTAEVPNYGALVDKNKICLICFWWVILSLVA
jgi:hypothetical protein